MKVSKKNNEPIVINAAALEKIVRSRTLSTYETVYNGVVPVMNDKEPEKVDYYISYEATVKAGLEFNEIKIRKDDENKQIIVSIPEITLQDPIVPIEKIDYIIVNKKVDVNGLIANAYKIAINDVIEESSKQEALFVYADQNAKNLITGLLSPFVEELDGYSIVFE